MASISLYQQARELEIQIFGVLSRFDVDELPSREKEFVGQLKNQLIDARLDARDYEYAETRAEQLQIAGEAKKRLEQLQQSIVRASEHNLFSAVDVAQLSARIQQLIAGMV